MLVILSVVAASVGVVVQRLRDQQLERQRQFAADVELADTRATVLYLLLTQRMTFGGLTVDQRVTRSEDEARMQSTDDDYAGSFLPVGNEIPLDNSPMQGLGTARFALQDDRGLIGVNWVAPAILQQFLARKPLPRGLAFETLDNLLRDYQDPDDLYRLNSAEKEEYQKRGRAPPTNRAIVSPLELRRIIGWDEVFDGTDDADLVANLTAIRSPVININTAPASVLASLPGVDSAVAERIVALRRLRPFLNVGEFRQLTGTLLTDEDALSLYPSASGTLKLWSPAGGTVQILHWTLTPRDDGGRPWREDYEFTLPADQRTTRGDARPIAAKVFAAEAPAQE
ncbi:type II secretion system protein GspK [Cognatilysobacter xinjiangensis]|uniref:type II secretion system protein GspK n=1 Tax=Cognatilysobacter xinjiangensis TaxID=546892 RepID=UPI001672549F|nr:type II secretion system protein GspK [Lysobacter xinjiangensis]